MEQKGILSRKATSSQNAQERTLFDTVGDELRRARMTQGLEIGAVANRLNIKDGYIVALENNDYTSFPAIVYGIGFLRTYAKFLGLDGDPLIERFKNETNHLKTPDNEMPIPVKHNVLPSKKTIVICLALLIGLWGIWYGVTNWNDKSETTTVSPTELIVTPTVPEPIVTAPIESDTMLNQSMELAPAELNIVLPVENPTIEGILDRVVNTENADKVTAEQVNIAGQKYGSEQHADIVLVAKDRVWMEVKENGKVIFNRILAKGDGYFVPADKTGLIMSTGNAQGLEVYVNGQLRGLVSQTGTVKKNIELKPETFEKH